MSTYQYEILPLSMILTPLFGRELHILNLDRVIEPGDIIEHHPLG
jgi:hypothetical protein